MANIILNTDDLTLTIEERGDVNTASNVGSGADIFKQKVGTDLEFRGINGGNNISTAVSGDNIDVSLIITNDVAPTIDNQYNLGVDSNKWAELYVEDFKLVQNNNRGEIESPRGIYWTTIDGNFEIDATDNDLILRTDASNRVQIVNNLVVDGDLDVNGALTTIDTTNLQVEDALIELNRGNNGADSGILIQRGISGNNAAVAWDESATKFKLITTTSTSTDTEWLGQATASLDVNSLVVEGTLNVTGEADFNSDVDLNTNAIRGVDQIHSHDDVLHLQTLNNTAYLNMNNTRVFTNVDLTVDGAIQANGGINAFTMNGNLDLNGNIINGVDRVRSHDTRLDLSTLGDTTYLQIDDTNGVSTNGWLSTTSNLTVSGSTLLLSDLAMGGNSINDVANIRNSGSGVTIDDSLTINNELIVNEITTPQFANQNTPRIKFTGDWSNAAHVAANGGNDISGNILMGAANLSVFTNSLPNAAMEYTTPNGHSFLIVGAQDDNGDDDAGHNSMVIVRGEDNVIRSAPEAGLPTTTKPLTIEAQVLNVETRMNVYSNNTSTFKHQVPDTTENAEPFEIVRENTSGGSVLADNSKVNLPFKIRDENGNQTLIGATIAVWDSTDGNSFRFSIDNNAGTDSHEFVMNEEYYQMDRPLMLGSYDVAGVPAAADNDGRIIRVTDGNAGSPCLAMSDGTNWKVIATLGANISST